MTDVERLAEVIGDHYGVVFLNGVWCCACGRCLANHKVDAKLRHDRHLADAVLASDWLAAHDAEVAARARREELAATMEWAERHANTRRTLAGPPVASVTIAELRARAEREGGQ